MIQKSGLAVTLALLAFGGLAGAKDAPHPPRRPRSLNEVLEPIRTKRNLPALAAAVVTADGVQTIGAVGIRRAGHNEPVTTDQLWHLGSCTKAAVLVTSNIGGEEAEKGTDEAAFAVIQDWLKR